jgi:hypothetical protein
MPYDVAVHIIADYRRRSHPFSPDVPLMQQVVRAMGDHAKTLLPEYFDEKFNAGAELGPLDKPSASDKGATTTDNTRATITFKEAEDLLWALFKKLWPKESTTPNRAAHLSADKVATVLQMRLVNNVHC